MDTILLYGEPAIRGEDLLAPPAWHAKAACAGEDTEAWYPEWGDATAHALDVCADCPAREPCLAWALEHDEEGVWGGTTAPERARIRRGEPVPERRPPALVGSTDVEPAAASERPTGALRPCGTPAAYTRHRRRGETPCDACREANTAKGRAWREQAA